MVENSRENWLEIFVSRKFWLSVSSIIPTTICEAITALEELCILQEPQSDEWGNNSIF